MNFPERLSELKALVSPGGIMKRAAGTPDHDYAFYNETHFLYMLQVEIMRTERSRKPFILLLLNISKLMIPSCQGEAIVCVKTALLPFLREIDIRGWYHMHHTIGIIFTEITVDPDSFVELVIHKIHDRFYEKLDPDWINHIEYTFHRFPEAIGASLNDGYFNKQISSVPYGS